MINIDGSFGEGGGQILRSALALSLVTGKPFRIENIRAKRKTPGLRRQHLTAVRAAARVGSARVEGDEVGSMRITFEPGLVCAGEYRFNIGTAGSTTLVLQTILLPLLLADGPSRVLLEGGTHNPFAPPFDFLAKAYLPLVNRMGPRVTPILVRHGFFPAGGGLLEIQIEPVAMLHGFELLHRGKLLCKRARVLHAHLPMHIAERELGVVRKRLKWDDLAVEPVADSAGPGNAVLLELEYENVHEVFSAFGQVGRSAETVASQAVGECQTYLSSEAPVGEHLTDQLLLPLAVAGHGAFRSTGLSLHAQTHIELIGKFLTVPMETQPDGKQGEVLVRIGR